VIDSLGLLVLGTLLGVRHAVDPDHVVAIGTIATRAPSLRRSLSVGALWGLGHSLTVLVVGGAIVLLRTAVPRGASLAMELAVAVMLIVLGLLNLHNASRDEPLPPSRTRPFLVGMVHGMAGSAAIALLVLATISGPAVGMVYLLLFGLGTLGGMMGVTALLAVPSTMLVGRTGLSRRWLTAASGVVSLVFGVAMMHALDGAFALLSANASLIPR
jgi:high-affinity nickel-transport protein